MKIVLQFIVSGAVYIAAQSISDSYICGWIAGATSVGINYAIEKLKD
jgi:hypothetical protein